MKLEDQLLSPSVVALRLGRSLATIKKMARSGVLPGAVFLPCGRTRQTIMFDPRKVDEFIENGGAKQLPKTEPPHPVTMRHVGVAREHASRNRNGLNPESGVAKHRGRRPTTDAEPMNPERIVGTDADPRNWSPVAADGPLQCPHEPVSDIVFCRLPGDPVQDWQDRQK